MIILASDTSTKSLSIAISKDGVPIGSVTRQTGTTHSQTYMPALLKLLRDCALDFTDIGLYACTVGPGSYTGIRIGVATTKAMAYAGGKSAVGISTLETLACPHQQAGRIVCPVLDARNRRVFSSCFIDREPVISEQNRTIEELLAGIADFLSSAIRKDLPELLFCGDAASILRSDAVAEEKLKALRDEGLLGHVSFLDSVPQAADTAALAYDRYCRMGRNLFDPFMLEASYLSPSQAERMKKPAGSKTGKEVG